MNNIFLQLLFLLFMVFLLWYVLVTSLHCRAVEFKDGRHIVTLVDWHEMEDQVVGGAAQLGTIGVERGVVIHLRQ